MIRAHPAFLHLRRPSTSSIYREKRLPFEEKCRALQEVVRGITYSFRPEISKFCDGRDDVATRLQIEPDSSYIVRQPEL